MAKKSYTEMFRELGKKGGTSKDFKDLYFKLKGKKPIKEIDINQEFFDKVMERYGEKKGGLITGKPKLAKKGWK
ncbi:MAG: hypothetical protein VW810_00045 [Pelagibacteraceae bacterium]